MTRRHIAEEAFRLDITAGRLEAAILHALLVINDHHDGCASPGSDCPVGTELRDAAVRAAPEALNHLLGIHR